MIISASRRTDIPAFFSRQLMRDIRAGFRDVPHPFGGKTYRVDLRPEAVDIFVFWTRDPRPLIPHLAELDERGYRYYFLFTLLDYPPQIEPKAPPLEERLQAFLDLSQRLGSGRVLWRYDPILITSISDFAYHRRVFSFLASRLESATKRVILSFYDDYRSTEVRLSALDGMGIRRFRREELFGGIAAETPAEEKGEITGEPAALLRDIADEAKSRGIRPVSCAEPVSLSPFGIEAAPCIDPQLIEEEFGLSVSRAKDRGQREECLCVKSRDIGSYGTCPAGCLYCYASR